MTYNVLGGTLKPCSIYLSYYSLSLALRTGFHLSECHYANPHISFLSILCVFKFFSSISDDLFL